MASHPARGSTAAPPTVSETLAALAAAGSRDPAVAAALDHIHRRYAGPLDVASLARVAGVSRSALAAKFVDVIGMSPMRYCARWRLHIASQLLRDDGQHAADVAFRVGYGSEAAFSRAFKQLFGKPPMAWVHDLRASSSAGLPEQLVRHCVASDGTRLAWSPVGAGPPLVKTANWLNHIEFDWHSPVYRHWLMELTRENCLIRYDERGNGMSDWDAEDLSLDAFIDDLESVVDAAGLDRFDLFGLSQGAAVAIAYAHRHPEKVRRMVLLGGYARGWALRLSGDDLVRRRAMVTLSRTGWGSDTPTFRQMFTSLYIPGGSPEQLGWWNELQRISTSPANAERLQMALGSIDVSALLSEIRVPTLVGHARRDQVIPFTAGVDLANTIPGAKFVELDSDNHVLLEDEPAWKAFKEAMRKFLRAPDD